MGCCEVDLNKNQCAISEPLCPSVWRNKLHHLYQCFIRGTTIILDPLILFNQIISDDLAMFGASRAMSSTLSPSWS